MANHHHLARATEEFVKLDRYMTLFQMQAFLYVATNEGQTQRWLQEKLGTSNAVNSRIVMKWSEYPDKDGKPNLGMIRQEEDPSNRSYRVLSLTPKGRQFLEKVKATLGDKDGNT